MREVPPFLKKERGLRLGYGTLRKLTAEGKGPRFKWFGRFKMFGDEWALTWADEILADERTPFRENDKEKAPTSEKERPDVQPPGPEQPIPTTRKERPSDDDRLSRGRSSPR
jgi:hypothetical protein